MVPGGALVPVNGGFEVYLRDLVRRDIDTSGTEPPNLLSSRQRFSLAHEIAHTYYYKMSDSTPTPNSPFSDTRELEKECNRTAGSILVPTALLRRQIKEKIDDPVNIDAGFVRSVAADFRASIPVVLERLSTAVPSDFERGVVLIRRLEGDAQIRACISESGSYPYFRGQKNTSALRNG
jgi:hypothetical protein